MEREIVNLLGQSNKIMLDILSLIVENNRWYTVREISISLDVVERTVQRYIHQLEELIDTYNQGREQTISLSYEKYKGVLLEIDTGSNFIELKGYIYGKDETIQLFKSILFEEFVSIPKYMADHFMSEAAIRSSFKKIRVFLSRYYLRLSRSTYQIEGPEKQVRLLMYVISWVMFKGVVWPFGSIESKKIYDSVTVYAKVHNIEFSEIQRKQMAYMLAINLIRLRKRHVVPMEENWRRYVDIPKFMKNEVFIKEFMKEYSVHVESELYFYAIQAQIKVKMYEDPIFQKDTISFHEAHDSHVYQATKLFMTRFSETFKPIPKELEERFFITSFSSHLFCSVFKRIHVDIDGYYLLKEVDGRYESLKKELSVFIDQLYEETKLPLFLEKRFLLQKYLLLFSSVLPLTHFEPKLYLYLDTDLPYFVKNDIRNRVIDRFRHDFNVRFVLEDEKEKTDIILTNIPNTIEEQERFSYRVQLFDYPIKTRDFSEIEYKLKRTSHNKQLKKE